MRLLAKLFAFFFAVLFILTAVPALFLSNLGFHLTRPQTYKAALIKQNIYEKFPKLASEQIYLQTHYQGPKLEEGTEEPPSEEEGGPPAFFAILSQEDMEVILSELLPPQVLKPLVEDILDQAFANFFSSNRQAPAVISLKQFKEHLAQGAALNAVLKVIRAQPPCVQEGLNELRSDISQLIACSPPEEVLNALTPELEAYLSREVIGTLPDEADLSQIGKSEPAEGEQAPPSEGERLNPQTAGRLRAGMILSPLLPFFLLALAGLFGARSKRSLSLWWGIPLSIVGILGIALALSLLPVLDEALANLVTPKIPPYVSANLAGEGLGVVREVVKTVAAWVGIKAGFLALAGGALVLYPRILNLLGKTRPPSPPRK